jgi:hypothetical protein
MDGNPSRGARRKLSPLTEKGNGKSTLNALCRGMVIVSDSCPA